MPRPSAPPERDLEEVERAISALQGRHPEHERTRRETMAAAEARREALEQELAQHARRKLRRAVVIAANVVALGAAVLVGWRLVRRTQGLRAALERAEGPFTAAGFAELASNQLSAASTLEADGSAGSCFVAVATVGRVHVRAGPLALDAPGSAAWCACSAEHVTLQTEAPDVGLALLRVDAGAIGGSLARSWAPVTPGAWGDADAACADSLLDTWIAGGHSPRAPGGDGWFDAAPSRASLRRLGFHVVSGVERGRPFGVVDGAAGDCFVALADADEPLSLRAQGGTRRMVHAVRAMAWCNAAAETTTVWRDGSSPVTVVAAASNRVGGLLGAQECAEIAGFRVAPGATWLRDDDLAWDAAALLRSSGMSDVHAGVMPAEPGAPDARLAALVGAPAASIGWQPSAVVACSPPLGSADGERVHVCASTALVSWWRKSDGAAAAARSALPFWLSAIDGRSEPDAVACIPELLALSRRLGREGFEPTIEGVTELGDGVRVVGRAGEDAIVAVGIGARPPWVFPYTDGVPWDLGDAPRVVALQPGLAVKLASSPPPSSPADKRRTVVFRHAARP